MVQLARCFSRITFTRYSPNPLPPVLRLPGAFRAVKGLEQVRQGLLRDVGTAVLHRQGGMPLQSAAPDADLGPFGRIERGVCQPDSPTTLLKSETSALTVIPVSAR